MLAPCDLAPGLARSRPDLCKRFRKSDQWSVHLCLAHQPQNITPIPVMYNLLPSYFSQPVLFTQDPGYIWYLLASTQMHGRRHAAMA